METKKDNSELALELLTIFNKQDWIRYEEKETQRKYYRVIYFHYDSGFSRRYYLTKSQYCLWRSLIPIPSNLKKWKNEKNNNM